MNRRKFLESIVLSSMGIGCNPIDVFRPQLPRKYELYKGVEPFVGDFETGDFSGFGLEFAHKDSGCIVTNPVRKGNYAVKFTLAPGDIASKGNRAELHYNNPSPYYRCEAYYGCSFMIDKNYKENGKWQMLFHFHDQPDWSIGETWDPETWITYTPRKSVLAMLYMNDTLSICTNSFTRDDVAIASFPAKKGAWVDMGYHVRWSPKEDEGFIEVMKDGKRISPFNGVDHKFYGANVYNKMGGKLKLGLYRDKSITSTNVVYFDEVKIGNSYEEVLP